MSVCHLCLQCDGSEIVAQVYELPVTARSSVNKRDGRGRRQEDEDEEDAPVGRVNK